MGTPAVFGVGMQTYNMDPSDVVRSANAVKRYAKQLHKQGRTEEALEILEENKDVRKLASKMDSQYKMILNWEKQRDDIRKNVKISPQQKAERTAKLDRAITLTEEKMKKIMEQDKIMQKFMGSTQ